MPPDPEREFAAANSFYKRGDLDAAEAAYRRTIALVPAHWAVHFSLGNVLYDRGRLDDAIAAYRVALRLKPDSAQACGNLGTVLLARAHPGDNDEAVGHLTEAVRLSPTYVAAQVQLGNALQTVGRSDEAIGAYRRALGLQPASAGSSFGLGNALQAKGDLAGAIEAYQDALRAKPGFPEAHNNLAASLKMQGHLPEALDEYREALAVNPAYGNAAAQAVYLLQELCIWNELETRCGELREAIVSGARLAEGVPPFSMVVADSSAKEQQLCARRWAGQKRFAEPRKDAFVWPESAKRDSIGRGRPRRVGFLSSDFHEHPVGFLMASVYEAIDRQRFEIVGYSFGAVADSPMRRRLQAAFTEFVDIRTLPNQAAARRIHDDNLDILVDLNGLTANARSEILAWRPAPIQMQFLGYPGTMGTPLVDYVIADRVVIPESSAQFFDEQVVSLPDCYQPNDPKRVIGQVPTRVVAGLPQRGFVFCSLNQTYKISRSLFDVWMRILKAVPDSVLWLLASNRWAVENLKREAEARGVSAERLIFAAGQPQAAHLARLSLADLVLDTRPVNSHTSASDALWAGAPVLTCPGDTFVSRVAASLLTAMDLPELIAPDLSEYERRAIDFADDQAKLAAVREKVQRHRDSSPVFNAVRFARHLEAAFEGVWGRYTRGEKPSRLLVERLP